MTDGTDALFDIPDELLPHNKPTHGLSLSVLVRGSVEWDEIHNRFCQDMRELSPRFSSVSLYSSLLDEEDGIEDGGEYFDEKTLLKVRAGIESGLSARFSSERGHDVSQLITDIIIGIQNEGILFRERS
jgi:hypothetical protein